MTETRWLVLPTHQHQNKEENEISHFCGKVVNYGWGYLSLVVRSRN